MGPSSGPAGGGGPTPSRLRVGAPWADCSTSRGPGKSPSPGAPPPLGAGQMLALGVAATSSGQQHRPPDQLLGERGRGAVAAPRGVVDGGVGEQRPCVETDQGPPPRLVRQGDLGGEVHPTGPLAE